MRNVSHCLRDVSQRKNPPFNLYHVGAKNVRYADIDTESVLGIR